MSALLLDTDAVALSAHADVVDASRAMRRDPRAAVVVRAEDGALLGVRHTTLTLRSRPALLEGKRIAAAWRASRRRVA